MNEIVVENNGFNENCLVWGLNEECISGAVARLEDSHFPSVRLTEQRHPKRAIAEVRGEIH